MAKDKSIELTGGVSEWNLSRSYAKYLLEQAGTGPLFVDVSSLGGDVNQALGIKKLFADRGDITVRYFGFNASSSTLLGHGAVKTQIYEDSFYLIHKPSLWIDAWGQMNADEIDAAIADLTAQKKDAETVTLMIAQDYVNNRGMEMSKVMELMKESRWLSAKEAVELKLVDELIPATSKKTAVSNEVVAMMAANGFPALPSNSSEEEEKTLFQKFLNFKNNSKNPKIEMRKDLTFINQVLAVEGVNESNGQITMSVEHVLALNNKIKADADSIASITAERDTAVIEKGTAETALSTFTNKVDELDATVKAAATPEAKVAAITAKLASRPAQPAAAPQGDASNETVTDSVNWEEMDNMPHNQAADKEYQFPSKTEK